jgi:hypothetical protein
MGGRGVREDTSPYASDGFPCRAPERARAIRGAPSQSEKPAASNAGNRGGYEAGEPTSCQEDARAMRGPRGTLGFFPPTGAGLTSGTTRSLDAPGAMTMPRNDDTCDWSGLPAEESTPATQAAGRSDAATPA